MLDGVAVVLQPDTSGSLRASPTTNLSLEAPREDVLDHDGM